MCASENPIGTMDSNTGKGGGADPNSQPAPDLIGRLAFRIATQLFGGRVNSVSEPDGREQQREAAAPEPAAPPTEEPRAMPEDLTEIRQSLLDMSQRLESAIDHFRIEAQRLSDETSRLALVADRLGARLDALGRGLPHEPPVTEAEPVLAAEETAPTEPQFQAADQPVAIVVAAVPGFQGLMDVQRGLSGLPAVKGASVQSYRNDEASLEMVLYKPVSARQVVDGLRQATGHELIIEESRPEYLRLRLRFNSHANAGRPADRLG